MLSPGFAFLLQKSPTLSLPLIVRAGLPPLARRLLGIPIPTWAATVAAVVTLPLCAFVGYVLGEWRTRRAAAALGARLAPLVEGKSIGNVDILRELQYNRKNGYPGDGLHETIAALGPTVRYQMLYSLNTFLTTSPEHIKLILATDFNNYVKGERFQKGMRSVLGHGVFNSDGEMWKFHRSMTRPFFGHERIAHFEIFDRHAEDVISILKERTRAGYAVDVQDLFGRFTMDSASEFLFDSSIHSLKVAPPYPHNASNTATTPLSSEALAATRFTDAFATAMDLLADRELFGHMWPLFEMTGDKTAEPMRTISERFDPMIAAAMEKKRQEGPGPKERTEEEKDGMSLLSQLLDHTSDPQVLKDEMLNILFAGRDTTMHTLTMIVYFFTMYPDVCQRTREEVLSTVGPTRRPTYDDIKDMKYLRAVINETMRLYPAVPFNVRENINATTWPSCDPADPRPIYIPAGSKLLYSVFMMHRQKHLWGPDAEEFSPERFLDDRLKTYLLKNTFQFLPFNAGPRICLGQQFAYNEMSFMIIRLLQAFSSFSIDEQAFAPSGRPPPEWAGCPGRKGIEKFRPKLHLQMYVEDGMWIKVEPAKN